MKYPLQWHSNLKIEFEKEYFQELNFFVEKEYATKKCYPPKDLIFEAFNQCSFEAVKVVIIGQDPYHGFGQAHGLCFSVNDGVKMPPSLINIFKELEKDLGIPIAISGNLERWAKQGVLLLNAVLTVEEGKANSHKNQGWERFTDTVIDLIAQEKSSVVFLLWGNYAHQKGKKIDRKRHLVLEAGHPSPLSANRGIWFGNQHFSKTNIFLKENHLTTIDW